MQRRLVAVATVDCKRDLLPHQINRTSVRGSSNDVLYRFDLRLNFQRDLLRELVTIDQSGCRSTTADFRAQPSRTMEMGRRYSDGRADCAKRLVDDVVGGPDAF